MQHMEPVSCSDFIEAALRDYEGLAKKIQAGDMMEQTEPRGDYASIKCLVLDQFGEQGDDEYMIELIHGSGHGGWLQHKHDDEECLHGGRISNVVTILDCQVEVWLQFRCSSKVTDDLKQKTLLFHAPSNYTEDDFVCVWTYKYGFKKLDRVQE